MEKTDRKRSWRNLVLDRDYQLAYTLLLVLSCALIMTALGYLVMKEADTATVTAIQDVQGQVLDAREARETIGKLESRRALLDVLLVVVGLGLCGGLFVYGIKMTHHVAGPLYKIGAYCDKVAGGRFDKLYNLRKHDQLVEFYDHFKQAHEAVRRRQERDVATLREACAAADDAELAARSPEIAARLEDLKGLLSAKEASLG